MTPPIPPTQRVPCRSGRRYTWSPPPPSFPSSSLRRPPPKHLVNTDKSGLALQGYDPVAFFTLNRAVEGKPELAATHGSVTYRFVSAEHKATFERAPEKYEPAFGGYCAYGVSQGGLFEVDIRTAQIVGGRLVLNKNLRVKEMFDQDRENRLRMADGEWPKLVQRHGKGS